VSARRSLGWIQVRTIAANTFREAVRSRIFYILTAFAVAMLLFSSVMGMLTIGSRAKIILDMGLTVTSLITVMTAIFVGIGLVFTEVEKKTIYNILSKPLNRTHFILGRYLGLMAVLAANLLAMLALLSTLLLIFGGFRPGVFVAGAFIYLELAVITAIALFFSSVTSPVVSAICTLAFYLVGHTSSAFLEALAPRLTSASGKMAAIWLFHLLPDLNMLNVTDAISYDLPIPGGFVVRAVLYAVVYIVFLLTAASMAFSRRDLV
jgi:ABC-type transport system involved in multi-copper enzyme maturation permease subunit